MSTDDVLAFFQSFGRVMTLNDMPQWAWSKWLPGCLNVKATKINSRLTLEQWRSYDVVKSEILSGFKFNARVYLERFRIVTRCCNESYRVFPNRLQELQAYYSEARNVHTIEEILDDALANQYLLTFSRKWRLLLNLINRNPVLNVLSLRICGLKFVAR
jgi:hypothetical protein